MPLNQATAGFNYYNIYSLFAFKNSFTRILRVFICVSVRPFTLIVLFDSIPNKEDFQRRPF